MKFLQKKPQVTNMNMNNNYFILYYTVIKVRNQNRDIDNRYEIDDNDYINFHVIIPYHHTGNKAHETLLR